MSTVPLKKDEEADPRAVAVFDDIRATRRTDYVNNFWRALANDPDLLEATWMRLKDVMAPGRLDPLVKELVYIAVSVTNGCDYCIRSHTAAARARGLSEAALMELMAVIAMANTTNRLATGLQVPVDAAFLATGPSPAPPSAAPAEAGRRTRRRTAPPVGRTTRRRTRG